MVAGGVSVVLLDDRGGKGCGSSSRRVVLLVSSSRAWTRSSVLLVSGLMERSRRLEVGVFGRRGRGGNRCHSR